MVAPSSHGERIRRYTDALRYGREMTVAIVAFPPLPLKTEIVTVSDQRLSYGEIIPAADEGTMKNIKLTAAATHRPRASKTSIQNRLPSKRRVGFSTRR